jgi:ribosomal protein S18 acetylase RimI-like enzyme
MVTIRPYQADDRAVVRRICYRTGYMGDPPAWFWRDTESFCDLFCSYYTDEEPESSFVVESEGRIVGYLLGCVDSQKVRDPARILLHHAVFRLCLIRTGTAGHLWRTMTDVLRDMVVGGNRLPLPLRDDRWPSHLHVDLLPEARGTGAGRALVGAWLDRLRQLGSPGCHVETLVENERAVAFFRSVGFAEHGQPVLVPGMRRRQGGRLHVQQMVRPDSESSTPVV